jgi:hypothetical protein
MDIVVAEVITMKIFCFVSPGRSLKQENIDKDQKQKADKNRKDMKRPDYRHLDQCQKTRLTVCPLQGEVQIKSDYEQKTGEKENRRDKPAHDDIERKKKKYKTVKMHREHQAVKIIPGLLPEKKKQKKGENRHQHEHHIRDALDKGMIEFRRSAPGDPPQLFGQMPREFIRFDIVFYQDRVDLGVIQPLEDLGADRKKGKIHMIVFGAVDRGRRGRPDCFLGIVPGRIEGEQKEKYEAQKNIEPNRRHIAGPFSPGELPGQKTGAKQKRFGRPIQLVVEVKNPLERLGKKMLKRHPKIMIFLAAMGAKIIAFGQGLSAVGTMIYFPSFSSHRGANIAILYYPGNRQGKFEVNIWY